MEVRYRHNVLKTRTKDEEDKEKREKRARSLYVHCESLIEVRLQHTSSTGYTYLVVGMNQTSRHDEVEPAKRVRCF